MENEQYSFKGTLDNQRNQKEIFKSLGSNENKTQCTKIFGHKDSNTKKKLHAKKGSFDKDKWNLKQTTLRCT